MKSEPKNKHSSTSASRRSVIDGEPNELIEPLLRRLDLDLWSLDVASGLVNLSKALLHRLGIDPDGWSGSCDLLIDRFHPEDRIRASDFFESIKVGDADSEVEMRIIDRSGKYKWIRMTAIERRATCVAGVLQDIHERRLVDERLSLALSAAKAGVWDWDLVNDIVTTNERLHLMLPEPIPQSPIGLDWFTTRLHPDDRESTMERVRASLADPSIEYRVEFRFRNQYGDYRWIESTGRVIELDIMGEPVRMVGLHIDADDRKKTELELRQAIQKLSHSEARLRDWLDHAPAAVAMFDLERNYVAASRRWLEGFKLEGERIIGRNCYEVFPDLPDRWKKDHEAFLRGEVRFRDVDSWDRPNGQRLILKWEGRPWYNSQTGAIGGFAIYVEDITARVNAERELLDAYSYLSAIMAASLDPVITINDQCVVRQASDSVDAVFGWKPDELAGQHVEVLMLPEATRRYRLAIDLFKATGDDSALGKTFEHVGRRKDGSSFPCEIYVNRIELPGSDDLLFALSIRDISERKQAQEEREARLSEIAHLSRLAVVDQMGVEVAHELKQPLGAIVNYAHIAKVQLAELSPSSNAAMETIDRISESARRVSDLIDNIRSFAKKPRDEWVGVPLDSLVSSALALVMARAQQDNVDVRIELGATDAIVLGNPIQLQQVVLNLVVNALDSLKDSRDSDRVLSIITKISAKEKVEVVVSDNGPGLTDDAADQAFNRFFSTKPTGLGMGLSISENIAEAHDGKLELVTPRPATFRLTLPLRRKGLEVIYG